jgi:hypothetical protein
MLTSMEFTKMMALLSNSKNTYVLIRGKFNVDKYGIYKDDGAVAQKKVFFNTTLFFSRNSM